MGEGVNVRLQIFTLQKIEFLRIDHFLKFAARKKVISAEESRMT
jgi:hypothetical protein